VRLVCPCRIPSRIATVAPLIPSQRQRPHPTILELAKIQPGSPQPEVIDGRWFEGRCYEIEPATPSERSFPI
jgi:hypothetical protein